MNLIVDVVEQKLENGLKILCLKKGGAPIVAVDIWYGVGSICEKDGIRGISHLLEHMMFRGSKKFGPQEHARRINDVGGHCNAMTAEDYTVYTNSVPKSFLDMVLEMEADRMRNLKLDKELFEIERKVIIEELNNYLDIPVFKAFLEFRKEFYRSHPYAFGPQGELQDLQNLTVGMCKEYYDRWYTPDNAVLVVVGDFEGHKQLLNCVEKHFGSIAGAKVSTEDKNSFETLTPAVAQFNMKRRIDFDVPMIIIGFPAPRLSHTDALYLEIIQLILSQGETGRLYKEIVRKTSLAVFTGGMNHFFRLSTMVLFFAAFTPDVPAEKVHHGINKVIDELIERGVDDSDLEKVRNSTMTSRVFEMYSAEQLCQRLGFSQVVEGDYHLWVKRLETLANLQTEYLREVAKQYMGRHRQCSLYIQPRKTNFLMLISGLMRRFLPKGK